MTGFAQDIAPLFREKDVRAMKSMFDLHAYDDVKEHVDAIVETVVGGTMPCDSTWSEDRVALLRAWIDEGFPT